MLDQERYLFKSEFLKSLENSAELREYIIDIFNADLKNPKSAEASEKARKKGNEALLQAKTHDAETHRTIFNHYCESVALAPMDSQELALAFGNRSYFLLHIHKYEDCIKDIDRALKITASNALKAKLFCRKAECLQKLDSSSFLSILEIAQSYVDKINGRDKKTLQKKVDTLKTLRVSNTENLEASSNQEEQINVLPLTNDYLSCVSIQYNKKYGRHLVAAKDYEPGDLIFAEKMYVTALSEGSSLSSCDYCSQSTWSSIPCDYCDWSMYCSERCKEKAWRDFHDIECSLISCMRRYSTQIWKTSVLIVRVLITAIKETGSIANLKKELESVDHCKDATSRGFFKNDQLVLNSIRNIYSLASDVSREVYKEVVVSLIPSILIPLVKHSKLKDNFDVKQLKDLFANEDIMFLGTLLYKIIAIMDFNAFAFGSDKEIQKSRCKPSQVVHCDHRCCLSSLFSLLNHSCAPTASWICTEPNKVFVYALQPIKRNSQIFISYRDLFYQDEQFERQACMLQKYNFKCDCEACIGAWLPIMKRALNSADPGEKEIDVERDIRDKKIGLQEFRKVLALLRSGQFKDLGETHIENLSEIIIQGTDWKQPSLMLWTVIHCLRNVFTAIYSPKSLMFDQCK